MCTRKIKILHLTSNGIFHSSRRNVKREITPLEIFLQKKEMQWTQALNQVLCIYFQKNITSTRAFSIKLSPYHKIFIRNRNFHPNAENKIFQLKIQAHNFNIIYCIQLLVYIQLMTENHESSLKVFMHTTDIHAHSRSVEKFVDIFHLIAFNSFSCYYNWKFILTLAFFKTAT